jgi:hypothetical protein
MYTGAGRIFIQIALDFPFECPPWSSPVGTGCTALQVVSVDAHKVCLPVPGRQRYSVHPVFLLANSSKNLAFHGGCQQLLAAVRHARMGERQCGITRASGSGPGDWPGTGWQSQATPGLSLMPLSVGSLSSIWLRVFLSRRYSATTSQIGTPPSSSCTLAQPATE